MRDTPDEVFIAWIVLLFVGAFVLGGLIEHWDNKRRVMPQPRRMIK